VKIWRPKDRRAVVIIRLVLWSALLTWMVFTLGFSIAASQAARYVLVELEVGGVWIWVVPIWIVFTTLMLIWAVARFAVRRLRNGKTN